MTTDPDEGDVSPSDHSPWTVHQGDSRATRDILESVLGPEATAEPFITTTITSPPYADLISYDSGPDQIGQQSEHAEYLDQLQTVFSNVYDLTVAEGTLWVVIDNFSEDNRIISLPDDIIRLCENLQQRTHCLEDDCNGRYRRNGRTGMLVCDTCRSTHDALDESWILHDTIIWNKGKARPFSGETRFRNNFEYILCFRKSESAKLYPDRVRIADPKQLSRWWIDWPERYNPRGIKPDNVWEIDAHDRGAWGNSEINHPAAFPPELVSRIIRFASDKDDVVFDPFAGSGTVVAQANVMERRGIGIELGESYVDLYQTTMSEIEQLWADKQAEGLTTAAQQQRLATSIWKLRQLVYANKLVYHLRTTFEIDDIHPLGLNTIFVQRNAPEITRSTTSVDTDYVFVFDDDIADIDRSESASALTATTGERPWSSFNIDPDIQTVSLSDVTEAPSEYLDFGSHGAYLYPRGEHHWYSRRVTAEEWAASATPTQQWLQQEASNAFVPLLSDLSIRIERGDEAHSIADIEGKAGLLDAPPHSDNEGFQGSLDVDTGVTRLTDF